MLKEIRNSDAEAWKKMHEEGMSYKEIADKVGYCKDTVYRYVTGKSFHERVSTRKSPVVITDEKVEDMKIYRELGLSNKQIAIEMGLSVATVHRHLGNQKDGHRADYGSIVAHTTGESFVPKGLDLEKAKEEAKMRREDKERLKKEPLAVTFVGPNSDASVIIPPLKETTQEKPMGDLKLKGYSLELEGMVCNYELSNTCLRINDLVEIPVDKLTDFLNELYNLQSVVDSRIFEML